MLLAAGCSCLSRARRLALPRAPLQGLYGLPFNLPGTRLRAALNTKQELLAALKEDLAPMLSSVREVVGGKGGGRACVWKKGCGATACMRCTVRRHRMHALHCAQIGEAVWPAMRQARRHGVGMPFIFSGRIRGRMPYIHAPCHAMPCDAVACSAASSHSVTERHAVLRSTPLAGKGGWAAAGAASAGCAGRAARARGGDPRVSGHEARAHAAALGAGGLSHARVSGRAAQ